MIGLLIALLLIMLAVIYVFLVMPRAVDRPAMDLLMADYAHRGLWNEQYPENSLSAFAHAVQNGYGIELDVHLTKDKKVMVFHDDSLERMCGVRGWIEDHTLAELRTLRLGGTQEVIPLLTEVFSVVDGKVPILIEIKGTSRNAEICEYLAPVMDKYHGAVCIQSFNPLHLSYFRQYRPRFARGLLLTKVDKKQVGGSALLAFVLNRMFTNVVARPDFLSVDGKIRKKPSVLLCRFVFRTPLFVFTARSMKEYRIGRSEGARVIFEKIKP